MRRKKLIARLRTLYILEFINAFALPFGFVIYCDVHNKPIGLNAIIAMTVNGILLVQGSYFWYCIVHRIKTDTSKGLAHIVKTVKPLNVGLLFVAIAFVVFHPFAGDWDRYGTIAFLSLAVLEYINYFEFQLMYDSLNDLHYLRKFGLKRAKLKAFLD